jgi:hypothetical protein
MAEIDKVEIHHPGIDGGERTKLVPRDALPFYQQSGWQQVQPESVEPPGEDAEQEPAADGHEEPEPAEDSHGSKSTKAPRRRASSRGDE